MSTLKLDIQDLFTESLQYACPHKADTLENVKARHKAWTAATPEGAIHSGYRRQITAREGLKESIALAQQLRSKFDTMIVLGIGGSALGARTALSALSAQLKPQDRKRVVITDNLDPIDFEATMETVDLKKTCIAIVTKSGGTIETMAQASELLARLNAQKLSLSDHVVAVTDPQGGALRSWVNKNKITALSLPGDVGGRFSVLSPVGLLPLAFAGIDVEGLVSGAVDQFKQNFDNDHLARMGLRLAELEGAGYSGKVLMPYATLLKDFGAWFVQLWGESLGKISFGGGTRGSLPVAAVGATDQHSLLQMLVEGPDRMSIGFIQVKNWTGSRFGTPTMKPLSAEFASLKFAEGKSFGDILNAEGQATYSVLKGKNRPVYKVELDQLNAKSLGALFALYMDLVVYVAAASNVNPFDQPGVELGKKILPSLLS